MYMQQSKQVRSFQSRMTNKWVILYNILCVYITIYICATKSKGGSRRIWGTQTDSIHCAQGTKSPPRNVLYSNYFSIRVFPFWYGFSCGRRPKKKPRLVHGEYGWTKTLRNDVKRWGEPSERERREENVRCVIRFRSSRLLLPLLYNNYFGIVMSCLVDESLKMPQAVRSSTTVQLYLILHTSLNSVRKWRLISQF